MVMWILVVIWMQSVVEEDEQQKEHEENILNSDVFSKRESIRMLSGMLPFLFLLFYKEQ
jgi:hypothetical protein